VTYDPTRLKQLGDRNKAIRAEQARLREELIPEIRAAADAGVSQAEIVAITGYTRETVRQIVRPEARDAVNRARRQPTPQEW